MVEKPIIFSGPMVRAILDGRKSQTRRVLKPRGKRRPSLVDGTWSDEYVLDPGNAEWLAQDVPYAVGDLLWVREAWRQAYPATTYSPGIVYRADAARALGMDEYSDRHRWRSPIHMPRKFSRISLKVTAVKVERLQDISEEDATAEGVPYDHGEHIHGPGGYRDIWEKIHGPGSWEQNPWVVAISFERLPPQGDST